MIDTFHWVIFALHALTALTITFGVWFRCSPDVWISRLSVDTYDVINNSTGLWWYDRTADELALCSFANASNNRRCFNIDLPLYEKFPSNLGWHLFVLLGHFEWISTAFAFFYIRYWGDKYSWLVSIVIVFVGTMIYMPYNRAKVFVNEVFVLVLNFIVCLNVFLGYRGIYQNSQVAAQAPAQAENNWGEGNLIPRKLLDVQLLALRFCEYCITAAELWVAVLSVFVMDAPAFMSLGGYTLILLTNLYGLLLHYSLASDNTKITLNCQPRQRYLRVPDSMLGIRMDATINLKKIFQAEVWGSFIASNMSTLLNSWLAYGVAMGLIFYQQTFLTSSEPPAFIVAAGWSLIISYTSFGIWMTLVYWYPSVLPKLCGCVGKKNTYEIAVLGLDILSLSSKLSIVFSLSWGFIFRAEGRCAS